MILVVALVFVALGGVQMPWSLTLVAVAAVVEVGETLFWIWLTKRRRIAVGSESLVGATAEVLRPCRPVGQVRVRGEIWRARCHDGAEAGERVRVRAVRGLEVDVERQI